MRRFEHAPSGLAAAAFLALAAAGVGCADAGPAGYEEDSAVSDSALLRRPQLTRLGSYLAEGGFDVGASEIVAYDAKSRTLFTVNAALSRIDRIDISDPRAPAARRS